MNHKDNILKYTGFCGARNGYFAAYLKNAVSIFVA
jgi:hypothetical protein